MAASVLLHRPARVRDAGASASRLAGPESAFFPPLRVDECDEVDEVEKWEEWEGEEVERDRVASARSRMALYSEAEMTATLGEGEEVGDGSVVFIPVRTPVLVLEWRRIVVVVVWSSWGRENNKRSTLNGEERRNCCWVCRKNRQIVKSNSISIRKFCETLWIGHCCTQAGV